MVGRFLCYSLLTSSGIPKYVYTPGFDFYNAAAVCLLLENQLVIGNGLFTVLLSISLSFRLSP